MEAGEHCPECAKKLPATHFFLARGVPLLLPDLVKVAAILTEVPASLSRMALRVRGRRMNRQARFKPYRLFQNNLRKTQIASLSELSSVESSPMRWSMWRTFLLFSRGVLAAILIASSTFAQTAPPIEVRVSDVIVTVPFKRGLSIYMESEGRESSLRADIRSSDRSRQYTELKNKFSGPVPAVALYVSLREFCSEQPNLALCIHSAQVPTIGAPYVSSILIRPINDRFTHYFLFPLEEVRLHKLSEEGDRGFRYSIIRNKFGNKFDCPKYGEFGLCRVSIVLFNNIIAILNFVRRNDNFDSGLSDEYFSRLLIDLNSAFHVKPHEEN